MNAADERSDIDFQSLLLRSAMSAAEADDEFISLMATMMPEGAAGRGAVDWIRFGQLLRERLGWDHYPDEPAHSDE